MGVEGELQIAEEASDGPAQQQAASDILADATLSPLKKLDSHHFKKANEGRVPSQYYCNVCYRFLGQGELRTLSTDADE